ncbi:MAG: hypothetical protein Q9218_005536 [Villophora microphyllina]
MVGVQCSHRCGGNEQVQVPQEASRVQRELYRQQQTQISQRSNTAYLMIHIAVVRVLASKSSCNIFARFLNQHSTVNRPHYDGVSKMLSGNPPDFSPGCGADYECYDDKKGTSLHIAIDRGNESLLLVYAMNDTDEKRYRRVLGVEKEDDMRECVEESIDEKRGMGKSLTMMAMHAAGS